MKIVVITVDKKVIKLQHIKKAVLTQSADAACDSLSVEFVMKSLPGEIERVEAYKDEKLIFSGYCDCQRATADKNGVELYIYARSSACVLVDNQAQAYTYNRPSALSLYTIYAKPYGFKCSLPDICSYRKYEVSASSSLFGALNNFVSMISTYKIRVNTNNEIVLLKPSDNTVKLDNNKIVSAKSVINRSEPISAVHYKKDVSLKYDCHTLSKSAAANGFFRQRYVNLASYAPWQRNYKISNMFKESFKNYKNVELTVLGYVEEELYQRFNIQCEIGNFDDYLLFEKIYYYDSNGEKTKLILSKNIDIKEVNYVDK
ncbi:MAG: hypothetical protein PUE60_08110 [Eubacteriales bacterium]|nr:hypothetical protein [Eubacteriales bacterium]